MKKNAHLHKKIHPKNNYFCKKTVSYNKTNKLDSPKPFYINLYIYLSVRNNFEELNQYL